MHTASPTSVGVLVCALLSPSPSLERGAPGGEPAPTDPCREAVLGGEGRAAALTAAGTAVTVSVCVETVIFSEEKETAALRLRPDESSADKPLHTLGKKWQFRESIEDQK